jgi:hypothetical protein
MTVVRELAEQLDPSMVVASGSAYEDTCRTWNGAVTSRPDPSWSAPGRRRMCRPLRARAAATTCRCRYVRVATTRPVAACGDGLVI